MILFQFFIAYCATLNGAMGKVTNITAGDASVGIRSFENPSELLINTYE